MVLNDTASFFYKCDNFYHKDAECGINPLDPKLGINWGLSMDKLLLSDKDSNAASFKEVFGL